MGERKERIMEHDFEYVTRKEYAPHKREVVEMLGSVKHELKSKLNFDFYFIGSSSRNMITHDRNSQDGYDFDVNISLCEDSDDYEPNELRDLFFQAFKKCAPRFGFNKFENSTRVITLKVVEKKSGRTLYGCDIALTYDDEEDDEVQWYIHFNKKQGTFEWQEQPSPYCTEEKAEWLREENLINEMKDMYIYMKDNNTNPHKKSRSLYAEAVGAIYNQYHNN